MVHRDVKPANIIITSDGTAMLTDFGIVHLRPEAQLTITGQLLGTPAYMSPEQIAGGEITSRTDVYQLAVVAYELLTGALPFRATEPAALLVAHLHEQPVPIDERVDDLPSAVSTTLERLCTSCRKNVQPRQRRSSTRWKRPCKAKKRFCSPIQIAAVPRSVVSRTRLSRSQTVVGDQDSLR